MYNNLLISGAVISVTISTIADAAKAKQLSLVVLKPAKPNIVSDYCTNAPYKTLDINGGKPTDG